MDWAVSAGRVEKRMNGGKVAELSFGSMETVNTRDLIRNSKSK